MAQQASIVKPDASGGFKLPIRQGDAARIDVVDVDLVVHGKDGSRYVLAGAGIEAMSDRPPQVGFADGAVSAASLLENVGVVETPELSIPVMSSLTERDVKTSEGDKSFHGDGTNEVAATTAQLEAQAEAQSQSEQMSPVAEASDATVEKMVEAVEKQVSKLHDKAADPAPVEAFEPPTAPAAGVGAAPNPVSLTPLLVLSMGNVSDTSASSGTTYQGTGGVADSAVLKYIDARDALQITMETIAGTAGNDVIYADGTSVGGVSYSATGTVSGTATFAKDFAVQISGYFTTLTAVTVTISGNSTPISIVGGTDLGGGVWSLPLTVLTDKGTFQIVYQTFEADAANPVHDSFTLTLDITGVTRAVTFTSSSTLHPVDQRRQYRRRHQPLLRRSGGLRAARPGGAQHHRRGCGQRHGARRLRQRHRHPGRR